MTHVEQFQPGTSCVPHFELVRTIVRTNPVRTLGRATSCTPRPLGWATSCTPRFDLVRTVVRTESVRTLVVTDSSRGPALQARVDGSSYTPRFGIVGTAPATSCIPRFELVRTALATSCIPGFDLVRTVVRTESVRTLVVTDPSRGPGVQARGDGYRPATSCTPRVGILRAAMIPRGELVRTKPVRTNPRATSCTPRFGTTLATSCVPRFGIVRAATTPRCELVRTVVRTNPVRTLVVTDPSRGPGVQARGDGYRPTSCTPRFELVRTVVRTESVRTLVVTDSSRGPAVQAELVSTAVRTGFVRTPVITDPQATPVRGDRSQGCVSARRSLMVAG